MAKTTWQKIWHFLWHEDSVASWVVSILVAFILIKFIVYPLLGVVFGTTFPVVAVVSDSMEHNQQFDDWWAIHEDLYLRYSITKFDFQSFPLKAGFNKGDIIFLIGSKPEKIERGDVIVFWGGKAYPIIHRVVAVSYDENGWFYETKGDNNLGQIIQPSLDERHIPYDVACTSDKSGRCDVVLGKAVFRIPFLGWVKILFVDLLNMVGFTVG